MPARTPLLSLALTALCLVLSAAALSAALASTGSGSSAGLRPPLSTQWTFSMDAHPGNTTRPLVQGDRVYVTHRGVLHCLDARTGAEQWGFSPEPAGVITSPISWEDLIIVGATDACLYALDAARGTEIWNRPCAGPVSPDPVVLDDHLMIAAGKMVYAIAPRTGQASWVCSLTSPAKAGPVTDGSMLYFLCEDTSVQCVDGLAGRYRWRRPFTPGPETFEPLVGQRRVIIATGEQVHGIARSGAIAWTATLPAGAGAAPTLVEDTLYVPCVDGQIYTLYARSGARRHGVALKLDNALTASPLVTDTVVAAGTGDGLICILDPASGHAQWTYRCRAPEQGPDEAAEFGIYAPIIEAAGSLYCLTGSGDLYCFSASAPDSAGPRFAEFNPEPGSALPAGQSLTPSFAVTDDGSGVAPDSVEGTLDGVPVDISFDIVSGVGVLLPLTVREGSHIVKVTAKDYRGNAGTAEWSFLTDASIAAPEAEPRTGGARAPRTGGRRAAR